jgi:hypothetical protein
VTLGENLQKEQLSSYFNSNLSSSSYLLDLLLLLVLDGM